MVRHLGNRQSGVDKRHPTDRQPGTTKPDDSIVVDRHVVTFTTMGAVEVHYRRVDYQVADSRRSQAKCDRFTELGLERTVQAGVCSRYLDVRRDAVLTAPVYPRFNLMGQRMGFNLEVFQLWPLLE